MIIVTGGAGFIGSNLIRGLNKLGMEDILIVDNLADGRKIQNLSGLFYRDYLDKDDFLHILQSRIPITYKIDTIFHQGACTVTTETNGKYMLKNNFEYSKILLHYALERQIPFIYASSAATYGLNRECIEKREYEAPLNVYGLSKFLFDQYVRHILPEAKSQVAGLRYFNVYGPGEAHKGNMASVVLHFNQQLLQTGKIRLFEGSGPYANGEQRRDFIHVEDIVRVNLWFSQHRMHHGIVNVGTGLAHSFNDVAKMMIHWHKKGTIEYIPFPTSLMHTYQHYTQANLRQLHTVLKYEEPFLSLEEGIESYLEWLNRPVHA